MSRGVFVLSAWGFLPIPRLCTKTPPFPRSFVQEPRLYTKARATFRAVPAMAPVMVWTAPALYGPCPSGLRVLHISVRMPPAVVPAREGWSGDVRALFMATITWRARSLCRHPQLWLAPDSNDAARMMRMVCAGQEHWHRYWRCPCVPGLLHCTICHRPKGLANMASWPPRCAHRHCAPFRSVAAVTACARPHRAHMV